MTTERPVCKIKINTVSHVLCLLDVYAKDRLIIHWMCHRILYSVIVQNECEFFVAPDYAYRCKTIQKDVKLSESLY